jgi:hypothetical protein
VGPFTKYSTDLSEIDRSSFSLVQKAKQHSLRNGSQTINSLLKLNSRHDLSVSRAVFGEDNGPVTRRALFRRGLAAASFDRAAYAFEEWPDIRTTEPDLKTPSVSSGDAAPGKRVRQSIPEYEGSDVHHTLYLPKGWKRGRRYPVIVEYAGNGNYQNRHGDVSEGTVEGSNLGYGISGGEKFLWLCLPYVNRHERKNEILWWGDPEATADYCKKAVKLVCERYGGDLSSVILAGFSRGAIACNYIGLRDDKIAASGAPSYPTVITMESAGGPMTTATASRPWSG